VAARRWKELTCARVGPSDARDRSGDADANRSAGGAGAGRASMTTRMNAHTCRSCAATALTRPSAIARSRSRGRRVLRRRRFAKAFMCPNGPMAPANKPRQSRHQDLRRARQISACHQSRWASGCAACCNGALSRSSTGLHQQRRHRKNLQGSRDLSNEAIPARPDSCTVAAQTIPRPPATARVMLLKRRATNGKRRTRRAALSSSAGGTGSFQWDIAALRSIALWCER